MFINQVKNLSKVHGSIKERDDKILELLLQGFSRKQIVEKLNVTLTMVNIVAERNQIFKNKLKQRTQNIINKLGMGFTNSEIAK